METRFNPFLYGCFASLGIFVLLAIPLGVRGLVLQIPFFGISVFWIAAVVYGTYWHIRTCAPWEITLFMFFLPLFLPEEQKMDLFKCCWFKKLSWSEKRKHLITLALFLGLASTNIAQETQYAKFRMNGAVLIASNTQNTVIGLPGPKLTLSPKIKNFSLEVGVLGVPSYFVQNKRLGLCMGSVVILYGLKWRGYVVDGVPRVTPGKGDKGRLILTCLFTKTNSWQVMPGVGWQF